MRHAPKIHLPPDQARYSDSMSGLAKTSNDYGSGKEERDETHRCWWHCRAGATVIVYLR